MAANVARDHNQDGWELVSSGIKCGGGGGGGGASSQGCILTLHHSIPDHFVLCTSSVYRFEPL